jgi:CheY-like chemotaxis protein
LTERAHVLLVEDHVDTRSMYAEYLGFDFDVSEAADGLTALEAIEARTPDVIITDLALPRMDGYQLIARLRDDARYRDIPVIALSGYSGAEHDARVQATRPDAVLQKPCLPEDLVNEITNQLRRKGGGA